MSDLGLSVGAVSAAGTYVPVRAIDPVRRRFPTTDEAGQSAADTKAQAPAEEDVSASSPAHRRAGDAARGGFSLVGAFTSFLASMFSQPEAAAAQPAAAMQAGAAAYARAASAPAVESGAAEVLPPSFPRLASGRAVDLTV